MAVLKKPNCECFPLDFLVVFRESLWLDPTGHYCSLLTSVYFCLQQLNRSQLGIIALSGARYKPLAFDTTKKKLHWWVCERRWWVFFFLCRRRWRFTSLLLSSFNWFSVAIGADLFFFFSLSHEQHSSAHCLGSCRQECVWRVVQDTAPIIALFRSRVSNPCWFRGPPTAW